MAMGNSEPSYAWPIRNPSAPANSVVDDPITAAAVPATCPSGSIAMEFRLPNYSPMQKNNAWQKAINSHNAGWPWFSHTVKRNSQERTIITSNATFASRCMPKRMTSPLLSSEAQPTATASKPK